MRYMSIIARCWILSIGKLGIRFTQDLMGNGLDHASLCILVNEMLCVI